LRGAAFCRGVPCASRCHRNKDTKMDNQKRTLEEIAAELIDALGIPDEHKTDDLRGTPARVARSLREQVAGYHLDPKAVLGDLFDVEGPKALHGRRGSMIQTVRPISFGSTCAHHLLPFFGVAKNGSR